jgi:hypothetical protein
VFRHGDTGYHCLNDEYGEQELWQETLSVWRTHVEGSETKAVHEAESIEMNVVSRYLLDRGNVFG